MFVQIARANPLNLSLSIQGRYLVVLQLVAWTDAGPVDDLVHYVSRGTDVYYCSAEARYFPQGIKVASLALLPSVLNRPGGSLLLGPPDRFSLCEPINEIYLDLFRAATGHNL